jgi:chemotaxis protein methyltransferase CheR
MFNKDVSDIHYEKFTTFLQKQSGIALGEAKRYLVRSRLATLMHEYDISDINTLIDGVVNRTNSKLVQSAINAMTTNETLWFRDNYPFDLLKSKIFPQFAESRKSINLWSAACSSGQEPYSIAMTFEEFKEAHRTPFMRMQITATDLSTTMIEKSSAGIYDELALSRGGLTPDRRRKFFQSKGDGLLEVNADLKKNIRFQKHNLVEERPLSGPFDIIFCRNVLIYFSAEVKARMLQQFAASLAPGGILFLGASESIGNASQYFSLIRCNPGLYYQLKS